MHQYSLGTNLLESSSVEKDLGVLVEDKLSMSQQCIFVVKKANSILVCIRKIIASRTREVTMSGLNVFVDPPGLLVVGQTSGESCRAQLALLLMDFDEPSWRKEYDSENTLPSLCKKGYFETLYFGLLDEIDEKDTTTALIFHAELTQLLWPSYVPSEESSLVLYPEEVEQPQLSQEVFHPSDHLCDPSLDMHLQVSALPVLAIPELDAVLQAISNIAFVEEAALGFCEKYPRKQQDSPQGMKTAFSCMGNGATATVVNIGSQWNGRTPLALTNGKKTGKLDSSAKKKTDVQIQERDESVKQGEGAPAGNYGYTSSGYSVYEEENDRLTESLHTKVSAIKSLSIEIGTEVKNQNKMLSEMTWLKAVELEQW
ncbi:hypothetical protein BTVI_140870 [Pitangus sulphuratus]|nr:hypothetical protein BTVI_140870 [Pitangus sulphuratus]